MSLSLPQKNSPLVVTALACLIVVSCWTYLQSRRSRKRSLPYPPGPPAKSLLFGNLSDVPTSKPWVTGKTYGDIVHFRVFGQHVIVLNILKTVKELIEKRSNIYSNRPQVPMLELMGFYFAFAFKPLRPEALLSYRPIQTRAMSHDPDKYDKPEIFNPDRHFDGKGNLMEEDDIYAFRIGRRICVGRDMASATVWLVVASFLSTFNIQQKKDASGKKFLFMLNTLMGWSATLTLFNVQSLLGLRRRLDLSEAAMSQEV